MQWQRLRGACDVARPSSAELLITIYVSLTLIKAK